jgi:cytidylate kinase
MIVAIDGPAGAGKSTIATEVAKRLGFQLIDTGAIYRTVALKAREREVPLEDGETLAEVAEELDFGFELRGDRNVIFCNGEELGGEIRTPENSRAASIVSAHPEVREALLGIQRALGRSRDSVLEGRDIGTVVFPDAEVKVFLTASPKVRARRRVEQLEDAGRPADYESILREIRERDERDSTRAVAPLIPADDAVEIDSTEHTIDEVVTRVIELVDAA